VTLSSFVPDDQAPKLAVIKDASTLLDPTLNPFFPTPPPSDAEVIQSLNTTAAALNTTAGQDASQAASDARRLAATLQKLASAAPAVRATAGAALTQPLGVLLGQIRESLQAEPVTFDTLPPELKSDWVAKDGRARIQVFPKGDSNNNAVLKRFAQAVRGIAPDATGAPISIQEAGATIVQAFELAGALALIAIVILLFVALRSARDVFNTMVPVLFVALLTLGTSVAIGLPINFANIIALPLMFGVGVAFHIYFVIAWRQGETDLLQSPLTRAVFFSALTTGAAFGSLWLSRHPGTASMGELLMISLAWTLVVALLFEPALLGPPKSPPAPHEGGV
jgi:hopanoid biosynthesis associated RND transporter like protein HpnN